MFFVFLVSKPTLWNVFQKRFEKVSLYVYKMRMSVKVIALKKVKILLCWFSSVHGLCLRVFVLALTL
jgi:hypothetical protein